MKRIKHLIDMLNDELCSAKEYAEYFIDAKVKNSSWSQRWREMSLDELKHASNLHEKLTEDIEELERVYTPPEEMMEEWEHTHKHYIEKAAWIRQMLSM